MDSQQGDPDKTLTDTAQSCLDAAYAGTLDFPAIVHTLIDAGFKGYGRYQSIDSAIQSATFRRCSFGRTVAGCPRSPATPNRRTQAPDGRSA